MYIIVAYDVSSKKDLKILKLLRKYLFHTQKSIFEGNITPSKFDELRNQIKELNIQQNEQIIIYKVLSEKEIKKDIIGKESDIDVLIV